MGRFKYTELEKEIIQDPRNRELWAVYGDELQSRGNMRGQLIAYELGWNQEQLQKISPLAEDHNRILERLKKESLSSYLTRALKKEQDAQPLIQVNWRYGYIRKINVNIGLNYGLIPNKDFLPNLFSSPASRFLYNLIVRFNKSDQVPENFTADLINRLQASGPIESLHKLHMDFHWYDHQPAPWQLDQILNLFPNLRYLKMEAGEFTANELQHEKIQELDLCNAKFTETNIEALKKSHLPALSSLSFRFQTYAYKSQTKHNGIIQELISDNVFPELKNLKLEECPYILEIFPAFVSSEPFKKLERLSVYNRFIPQIFEYILENVDKFRHLKNIRVFTGSERIKSRLKEHFGRRITII